MPDDDGRLEEYVPGFGPERFAAHEQFFVDDVRMGAVALRTYLVAGTLEPFFQENASRWADALRGAGADVVMTERVGTHGDPFWAEELPLMVAWAFGRSRGSTSDDG